jgi:hypothetical protein
MYGADVNSLRVYIKNDVLGAPLWSRSYNQGDSWLRGEYKISDASYPYKVVFEAVIGKTFQGVSIYTLFFCFVFAILTCKGPTSKGLNSDV